MIVAHIVIVPLVIAKQDNGQDLYLYEGQPVPGNVRAAEIHRLEDGGYIESTEKPAPKK